MYVYTDFDQLFVRQRAAQYRDQLQRHLAGQLPDEDFRPLRLQNGWYVQRHAPMLRVAVPYGELSSAQLRGLARVAREYDHWPSGPFAGAGGFGHLTTRQNVQFNWIPLERSADVMDLLASVDLHGIQTSGNCIRNITSDCFAGIAADELIDPRPYCEIMRQWSTLHPEFAFLPRKFKIAVTGAREDRAAIGWHDIGLQLLHDAAGQVGFKVLVGGGMGRTPVIGTLIREFLPWQQILVFIEAIVRVYNRYGRRDNIYKARIKILVKAEGQRFIDDVNAEFRDILERDVDGALHVIPQAEFDRVAACFALPAGIDDAAPLATGASRIAPTADAPPAYARWLERNVHPHKIAGLRAVTLSLKRTGQAPGDATAAQMDLAADLADRYSHGELRVSHDQNFVLPWVREADLFALWDAARAASFATPNIGLLTDMIACPGGDLCALANARSIPIAADITERFDDLDELWDIGDIDLHISGCINSCGHHHSGHIGILGVDKDGAEWYQVTLGGSDGSTISGASVAGKVIGPSFAADEVADVMEALVGVYKAQRQPLAAGDVTGAEAAERFIDTVKRIGIEPFKNAANAVRRSTAKTGAPATWTGRLLRQPDDDVNPKAHATDSRMKFVNRSQDPWHTVFGDDGPMVTITRAPHRLLTLLQWRGVRSDWPAGMVVGVALDNDHAVEDIEADLPRLSLIVLAFPKWTDGRAYSQAHLLRQRYRFAGELRATGEVLVDMLPLLARTGFDSVVLRADQSRDAAERALAFFAGHYQGDVSEHRPRFALTEAERRVQAQTAAQPDFVQQGASI